VARDNCYRLKERASITADLARRHIAGWAVRLYAVEPFASDDRAVTQQDTRPYPVTNIHLRISGRTALGIIIGFVPWLILAYLSAAAQDMGQRDTIQTNPMLNALFLSSTLVLMLVAPAVVLVELVVGLVVRHRDRQTWLAEQCRYCHQRMEKVAGTWVHARTGSVYCDETRQDTLAGR
jgi:hypothetical protein